jgi:hypothetical protein
MSKYNVKQSLVLASIGAAYTAFDDITDFIASDHPLQHDIRTIVKLIDQLTDRVQRASDIYVKAL